MFWGEQLALRGGPVPVALSDRSADQRLSCTSASQQLGEEAVWQLVLFGRGGWWSLSTAQDRERSGQARS